MQTLEEQFNTRLNAFLASPANPAVRRPGRPDRLPARGFPA